MLFLLLLVIDVGNWYVHKRHLQMQADAAALAGGAYFGDCFSPDPAKVSGANVAIKNAATAYAGNAASTYNFQVGGGAPRVTTRFNSKTFAVGSFVDSSVDIEEPCQTPHLMFDVKQTEADVPYILGSMVDALVPGGTSVVPAINARARVQLKKAVILQGSLPLAVPDVDPKHVTVTYVDESAGGSLLAGPFELTKGTSAGGLNYWSGSVVGDRAGERERRRADRHGRNERRVRGVERHRRHRIRLLRLRELGHRPRLDSRRGRRRDADGADAARVGHDVVRAERRAVLRRGEPRRARDVLLRLRAGRHGVGDDDRSVGNPGCSRRRSTAATSRTSPTR